MLDIMNYNSTSITVVLLVHNRRLIPERGVLRTYPCIKWKTLLRGVVVKMKIVDNNYIISCFLYLNLL